MAGQQNRQKSELAVRPPSSSVADLRFRNLLSKEDWDALPFTTRQRFSKRLSGGKAVVYVGEVVETRMSRVGWLFAQLARLIGGPLPLFTDTPAPSVVTVTEDVARGGQIWTRLYARRSGFPQIIQSAKLFQGLTGLEECVGCGIGMALRTQQVDGALQFHSDHYFLRLRRLRLTIPRWMTPGAITVTHRENGDRRFVFALEVRHPLFGLVLSQRAIFRDETVPLRLCEDRPFSR
jgi:hypothetical protein